MIRELEFAYAAEAAAHARAAAELNPLGEAEALELGLARAVYSGQWSPVHGVIGLGLDGPVEERDLQEVDRFFFRKERSPAYWLSPATDSSLFELLSRDFQPVKKVSVHGVQLNRPVSGIPDPAGENQPELKAWALAFTKVLDPAAMECGLLALTKLHQKETRFYLGSQGSASYTFFNAGIALAPIAASAHSLLALQLSDAAGWGAKFFAGTGCSPLPLIYERTLYERISL